MRRYWRYTRRTINGRRRRVKVYRKQNGKYLVRVLHYRNQRD